MRRRPKATALVEAKCIFELSKRDQSPAIVDGTNELKECPSIKTLMTMENRIYR